MALMRHSSIDFIQPVSDYLSLFWIHAAGFVLMKSVLDSLSCLCGELCSRVEVSFGLFKLILTSCRQNWLKHTPKQKSEFEAFVTFKFEFKACSEYIYDKNQLKTEAW